MPGNAMRLINECGFYEVSCLEQLVLRGTSKLCNSRSEDRIRRLSASQNASLQKSIPSVTMKLCLLLLVGARAGISPKTKPRPASNLCRAYAGYKQSTITDAATAQDRLLDRRRHESTHGHQPHRHRICGPPSGRPPYIGKIERRVRDVRERDGPEGADGRH